MPVGDDFPSSFEEIFFLLPQVDISQGKNHTFAPE
jgi:hypothetical protein